jgi:hypothetical protein
VLSGLARSMSLLVSAPTHPLLWSLLDAPTPPTTYTDDRCCRIDYLLYQSSLLQLRAVDQLPLLTYPIPVPTQHPSDHLPIAAHFALAHPFDATLSAVREWFACVSGASVARPLCAGDLREAFRYFDKECASLSPSSPHRVLPPCTRARTALHSSPHRVLPPLSHRMLLCSPTVPPNVPPNVPPCSHAPNVTWNHASTHACTGWLACSDGVR